MSTITLVAALSENQNAWAITLVVGVVILLVVIALLEILRRTVVKLNDDLWGTWVSGKAVVKNTATSYQLKNARQAGDELVEELRNHG
jgi:competence protein ComGC